MRGAFLNNLMLAVALATVTTITASAQPQMTTVAKAIDSNPNEAPKDAADPRAYLNEIDGDKAMNWVKAHNLSTVNKLSKDPRYSEYQADILKILQATDRIASPGFAHGGMIDNFWQDGTHVQGLWRRTTWESYRSGNPQWRTILDVDALSKVEGKTWVFEGGHCLPPANNLCLISLSDGGKDADVVREFDIAKGEFVKDGFVLPEGKQSVTWVDEDTIYVTREWTPGEVTASGYAYVTKVLKRGQSLGSRGRDFPRRQEGRLGWARRTARHRRQVCDGHLLSRPRLLQYRTSLLPERPHRYPQGGPAPPDQGHL